MIFEERICALTLLFENLLVIGIKWILKMLSLTLHSQFNDNTKPVTPFNKIFLFLWNNFFFSYAGFIPFIGVFVSDAFQTLDGNLALGKYKGIVIK